jgi:hypothetical protein
MECKNFCTVSLVFGSKFKFKFKFKLFEVAKQKHEAVKTKLNYRNFFYR